MLYIFLAKLTDRGRDQWLADPDRFSHIADELQSEDAQLLARYAVLGRYDLVFMAEANSPDAIARLSVELGARGGLIIETLSAVSVGFLAQPWDEALKAYLEQARRPEDEP